MSAKIEVEFENIGIFRGKKKFQLNKGLNIVYAPNASGKSSLVAGLKAVSVSALSLNELARTLNDYEDLGKIKLVIDGEEYSAEIVRKPDGSIEISGKRLSDDGIIKKVAFIDMENDLVSAIYAGDEEKVERVLREISGITYIETILDVTDNLKSSYEYSYETKRREYEIRKEEIEKERLQIEKRLHDVRKKIEEILRNPEIEPARKEIEEIENQRRKIEKEKSDARQEEIELNNRKGLLERDYRNLKAELDVLIEKRNELEKERTEIERKIIEIRKEIEKLEGEVEELKKEESKLINEIRENEELLRRRKQVLEYAKCPYCGASINRDELMKEIVKIEDNIFNLRDKLSNIRKSIEDRVTIISELKEKGESRLEEIKKEFNRLDREINKIEKDVEFKKQKIREIEKELKGIREILRNYEEKLRVLDRRLEAFKDVSPLIGELRKLQSEEAHLSSQLDYTFGRLRQLEQVYEEIRVLKNRIETCTFLSEYFRIRLEELKNIIVERVNEGILRNFKLLRLAELEYPILSSDFSLTLTRTGGTPTTLAELSDAEKAILTILLAITLKDFVAQDFPFYVVDTLIEFIDDSRAKEIVKYLTEIGQNDKVLVVTKTKPYSGEQKVLTQEDIIIAMPNF